MLENFRNHWRTSITGIFVAVVTILGIIGVITPDQQTGLQLEFGKLIEAVSVIVTGIGSIILMFKAKDG